MLSISSCMFFMYTAIMTATQQLHLTIYSMTKRINNTLKSIRQLCQKNSTNIRDTISGTHKHWSTVLKWIASECRSKIRKKMNADRNLCIIH